MAAQSGCLVINKIITEVSKTKRKSIMFFEKFKWKNTFPLVFNHIK